MPSAKNTRNILEQCFSMIDQKNSQAALINLAVGCEKYIQGAQTSGNPRFDFISQRAFVSKKRNEKPYTKMRPISSLKGQLPHNNPDSFF